MRRAALSLTLALLAAAPAAAQSPAWIGPDPVREPDGRRDVDFALAELCFPYLLQDRQAAALADRGDVAPTDRTPFPDGASYEVGGGDLIVGMAERRDGRDCSLAVAGGDVASHRAAFDARMAQWPQPLALAPSQYPANGYDSREFLCSSAPGPNSRLLISTRAGSRGVMMVTLSVDDSRMARCDDPAPSAEAAAFAADPGPAGVAARVVTLIDSCRKVVKDSAAFDAEGRRLGLVAANGNQAWMSMAVGAAAIIHPDSEVCLIQSEGDPDAIRGAVLGAMDLIEGSFRLPPPSSPAPGWETNDAWRVCNADGAYVLTLQTADEDSDRPSAFLQMAALFPPPDPCPTTLIMPPESVPGR